MIVARWSGWIVVGALLLVMTVTHGIITSGLPVLDKALLNDLHISRGDLKFRETIFLLSSGLSGLAIGVVTVRIPPRFIVLSGLMLLSATLFTYGHARSIGQIYGLYVLLGLSFASAHVVVVVLMVREHFTSRRALATSVALSGTSLGAAIFPNITVNVLNEVGWRGALNGMALLPLALLPVAAFLLLHRWRPSGAAPMAADAALPPSARSPAARPRGLAIAMLLVATFGTFFASTSIILNLFLYLQDLGWSPKLAAAGLSTVFLVGLFAKTLVGLAAERWGVPTVWRVQQAILLLGATLLTAAVPGLLFPALALVGLGWAGCYVLTQVVIADFFAGPYLSRMTGLFIVFEAISSGSGVWSAGAIFDVAGSYRPAFILDCVLIVAALAAGWVTTRPALRSAQPSPNLPPSPAGYSPPPP
jgi:MFS family permease